MNNFALLHEEMQLSESLFDILSTLKRAFSEFRTNVTKKGMTIDVEDYEVDGIYAEIMNKASEKGFKQVKADVGYKYEFISQTGEIFKVTAPKPKTHVTTITLEFN